MIEPVLLAHHGDVGVPPGAVDLAVNVRPGGPPDWLAQAIAAADLGRYPNQTEAVAAVARRHGRPESHVLLTNGAAEAFVLIARALPGAAPAVVHPQFTEPELGLRGAGRQAARIVLPPPFRLDPALIPPSADLVFIGNPTNPTSVLHERDVLDAIRRPGRTIVLDEAFADFVPGEPQSFASDADAADIVVIRSLTKTWGLAGLRVGYVLGDPGIVEMLRGAQAAWPVSAPALAACIACSSPAAVEQAQVWAEETAARRDRLAARLVAVSGVRVAPDPSGPFVLIETDRADMPQRLLEDNLAVRRADTFPGLGPHWIRIAVRDDAVSDLVVAALERALSSTRSHNLL